MSDFITYRFPGKEKQFLIGEFFLIDFAENYEGFVVSTFLKEELYGFKEIQNSDKQYSFSTDKPYCVNAREYYMQAHELLNGMNYLQMDKAVFSRVKKITFSHEKLTALFDELCVTYPSSFVYLMSGKKTGTWIGASPEILLEVHGKNLFTCALASTKKVGEQRAWSNKEKIEHEIVKQYVSYQLKKLKIKEIECSETYEYDAGPVTHLRTDISATLNEGVSIFQVVQSIHPTPAVCGSPMVSAMELIQTVEQQQRRFYTGFLGTLGKNTTKLYVNLRCAQAFENELYLYLGGGYTLDSIPEMEWIETENKSKTLLHCIKNV